MIEANNDKKAGILKPISKWLPSRGNVLFTALAMGALIVANRAGALSLVAPDAPTLSTNTIPYQGRIANSSGTPLTGNYEMTFALYSQLSGSTALWVEAWAGGNSVRISDGLFNVLLGSLQPIPQNIIAGNNNLWLGVKVGSDAEMSPRVQLGSVPFATQALTVPDGSISKIKLASDVNLVPGEESITTAMLANAAVTGEKISPSALIVKQTRSAPATFIQSATNFWCASAEVTFDAPFPTKTLLVTTWVNVQGTFYGMPVAQPYVLKKDGFSWNSCFYYPSTVTSVNVGYNAVGY